MDTVAIAALGEPERVYFGKFWNGVTYEIWFMPFSDLPYLGYANGTLSDSADTPEEVIAKLRKKFAPPQTGNVVALNSWRR